MGKVLLALVELACLVYTARPCALCCPLLALFPTVHAGHVEVELVRARRRLNKLPAVEKPI